MKVGGNSALRAGFLGLSVPLSLANSSAATKEVEICDREGLNTIITFIEHGDLGRQEPK